MFGSSERIKRYVAAIALVGTLATACIRRLPADEARNMSALASQIETGLRGGNPDKQKIKEFARLAAKAKREYNLKIQVPRELAEGVSELSIFYAQLAASYEQLRDIERADYPFAHFELRGDIRMLLRIEGLLGITLEEERQALREYNQRVLAIYEQARKATKDEGLQKKLNDKIAGVIDVLKALQG